MTLLLNPVDAQRLGLKTGDRVRGKNAQGQAEFTLQVTDKAACGTAVSEGVWWQEYTKGGNVNRLTSQRTTDRGEGSTFYDVRIDIERI